MPSSSPGRSRSAACRRRPPRVTRRGARRARRGGPRASGTSPSAARAIGSPVADQEEQHEQHRGERHDRADRAEDRGAAERRELLEQALAALQQPGLHFHGADLSGAGRASRAGGRAPAARRVRAVPPPRSRSSQSRSRPASSAAWRANAIASAVSGPMKTSNVASGQQRVPRSTRVRAATRVRRALRRLQQEGEEQGPGQRREQRLQDPVEQQREQREAGQREQSAVEDCVSSRRIGCSVHRWCPATAPRGSAPRGRRGPPDRPSRPRAGAARGRGSAASRGNAGGRRSGPPRRH